MIDKNEGMDDDPIELDGRTALSYEDHILAALLKERRPEETERGLMKYYGADDSVNSKVRSYVFTIERVQGQLMGVAECHVQGDLTAEELDRLKETIIGQAADGFGEGFEQRPIKTGDGEIYVSLWSSDKSWSIMSFFTQDCGGDEDGESAEEADDFALPHDLLRAAGIPIDGDLDVTCVPGTIIIRESDVLDRLPDGLREIFRSFGIHPDTVREVMKKEGYFA